MDFSKLSKALSPVNLGDTTLVTVSPQFKLRVCQMVNYNQVYQAKTAAFAKDNPSHKFVTDTRSFLTDWYAMKQTPETVSFMAHVIISGWEMLDDEGHDVEYTPQNAVKLLTSPLGKTLFGKLTAAVQNDSLFQLEWDENAVKN